MRSTTVRRQLTGLLLSALAVSLLSLVITLGLLRSVRSAHADLEVELIPTQQMLSSIDRTVVSIAIRSRTDGSTGDPLDAPAIGRARSSIADLITSARDAVPPGGALADDLDEIERSVESWLDAVQASVTGPSASTGVAGTASLHDEVVEAINRLSDDVIADIDAARGRAASGSQWILVMLIITALALGIGTMVSLAIFRRSVLGPLDRLVREINAVADGALGEPIVASGPSDLASVGTSAERMRLRLLDDAERRTESAVIAGHLAESSRIAGQLHDDQVQAMTLVSIRLQQLARRVQDDPELAETVAAARTATQEAVERLRRMMFELHSPVIEAEGLVAAIEVYLDETFDDDVTCIVDAEVGELPPATAALAYRLAREALMNVFKHAEASAVRVELRSAPGALVVRVSDDGVGFDPDAVGTSPGHLGVRHAEELAVAAGGSWAIRSSPGAGTDVTIQLPIRDVPVVPAAG